MIRKLLTLVWDIGLPVGAYYACRALGFDEWTSLLASTVVAALRVVWFVVREGRLEPFATFMLAESGVGLVLSVVSGDARFLLAKDSFGTAVAGVVFLVTCFVGRPMLFHAARLFSLGANKPDSWWDDKWENNAKFRILVTRLSAVWGAGLLAEGVLRLVLVYALPLDVMAGLSPLMRIGTFVALGVWNFWYVRRMKRRLSTSDAAELERV